MVCLKADHTHSNLLKAVFHKFYLSIHEYFVSIMTSTQKGGGEVLKFVTCLRILLFLNNKSIAHFCG